MTVRYVISTSSCLRGGPNLSNLVDVPNLLGDTHKPMDDPDRFGIYRWLGTSLGPPGWGLKFEAEAIQVVNLTHILKNQHSQVSVRKIFRITKTLGYEQNFHPGNGTEYYLAYTRKKTPLSLQICHDMESLKPEMGIYLLQLKENSIPLVLVPCLYTFFRPIESVTFVQGLIALTHLPPD